MTTPAASLNGFNAAPKSPTHMARSGPWLDFSAFVGSPHRPEYFSSRACMSGFGLPSYLVGDDFFIVSEFVEDGSLGDRLKQGPIPPEQSCRWLAEIADALDYAHKNGVIHRDIKPANILIDHHGRALLADFGIALSANKTGQFAPSIGTLAYMSPEQLEGKPLDPRSDVYSVGVLLCQLLTRKLPYDARDTNSLKKEIVSGAIHLSRNGGTLSPELRGICLKCLAHDPKERYATAKDLANELRSVQPFKGPDKGVGKVARGGSWDYGAIKCRSAQRFGGEVLTRSFTNFAFGFRVVMVQEARP